MRIHSMTATFGKLEHATLTLQPGLNILEAPNEWGKSTWCAFLAAMLYGIDSRAHSATKAGLADKTRYEPWSGSPMSGRMEVSWNGRDITLERTSTRRGPFRQFRAFETATGLPVPELTAENCGELLVGVEKEVFLRAGFVRLEQMPVTQNEALRRRLNALVSTGDESGRAEQLASQLNKLKNECRSNSKTGLLPKAQAQRAELEEKLTRLQKLKIETQQLEERQTQLERERQALQNHKDALLYESARENRRRLSAAREAEAAARQAVDGLTVQCAQLPQREQLRQRQEALRQLQQMQQNRALEQRFMAQPPQAPRSPTGEEDPAAVAATVRAWREECEELSRRCKRRAFPLWGIALALLAAAAGLWFVWPAVLLPLVVAGLLTGILQIPLTVRHRRNQENLEKQLTALKERYSADCDTRYTAQYAAYQQTLAQYRHDREMLENQNRVLEQQLLEAAEGSTVEVALEQLRTQLELRDRLENARRELRHAEGMRHALSAAQQEAPMPTAPDSLTLTGEETEQRLSQCAAELRQLQLLLGRCQGQMSSLGQTDALEERLEKLNTRIGRLEQTLSALTLAQETLASATAQLQRRFAPRIAGRAKVLFAAMTGGRYDRLTLDEELMLHVGARGEDTLRSALWRSDGTADQLYLALRLAVARELTPEAPLILDDALVRFDDDRLKAALAVLQEEAKEKQVILFTCQTREERLLNN